MYVIFPWQSRRITVPYAWHDLGHSEESVIKGEREEIRRGKSKTELTDQPTLDVAPSISPLRLNRLPVRNCLDVSSLGALCSQLPELICMRALCCMVAVERNTTRHARQGEVRVERWWTRRETHKAKSWSTICRGLYGSPTDPPIPVKILA